MMSLREGLAGIEVPISGMTSLYNGGYLSPYWVGSITTESQISGLNGFFTGSLTAGVVISNIGSIIAVTSPTTLSGTNTQYATKIQFGVAGPLLAATGSIVFGQAFAGSIYSVTITPMQSGTIYPAIVSGTLTYVASGLTFTGQSGLTYNWIAVGV